MKEYLNKIKTQAKGSKWLLVSDGVVFVILALLILVFIWQFRSLQKLSESNQNISNRLAVIETTLATTTKTLADKIAEQQSKTSSFEDAISDINDSVGTLQKLSQTDKELLQKYSRVYFLSENYIPTRLTNIPDKYLFDLKKPLRFHSLALPYLKKLLDKAATKGIDLKVSSAYRSFGDQSTLKSNYLVTYGSGANQFSADQGYSEHQLGTAVDLISSESPALTIAFENTKAYDWLQENAWRYGFVLSYPKNNKYYQYEPWHWRFVGVSLATDMHDAGENFADMEQRELDKYLINIFD